MSFSSRITKFYNLKPKERLNKIKELCNLTEEEADMLANGTGLSIEQADRMIENVIGIFPMSFGIATNFRINDKDVLIPMVIEEPSVVAAASNAAKMARKKGGFYTSASNPIMIGQIQILHLKTPYHAKQLILRNKAKILSLANQQDPILVKLGGGAKELEVRVLDTARGAMLILHLLVDVRDAMGANAVNTMAEAVAPLLEDLVGGTVNLRIISNLALYRIARATAVFAKEELGGPDVVEGILDAHAFAVSDPFRAATHNKGVMNGITAVALATGNDTRAIEAGVHAYASFKRPYQSVTWWEKNQDGDLTGSIEIPLAVGLVGGATKSHPIARIAVKILQVSTANELAQVMAAVGLAQNLGALRALADEGIQKGHMALHSRNIAVLAGAQGKEIDIIAKQLVKEQKVRVDRAKELLAKLRAGK
ncbi:MAG: hydroxymethylglutaryl-CoA reductase, degradative [Candidatus Ranarchaeia archaeon]